MEKIKKFFSKINLFLEHEIDNIEELSEIKVEQNNNKYECEFTFNNVPKIQVLKSIINKFSTHQYSDSLAYKFTFLNLEDVERNIENIVLENVFDKKNDELYEVFYDKKDLKFCSSNEKTFLKLKDNEKKMNNNAFKYGLNFLQIKIEKMENKVLSKEELKKIVEQTKPIVVMPVPDNEYSSLNIIKTTVVTPYDKLNEPDPSIPSNPNDKKKYYVIYGLLFKIEPPENDKGPWKFYIHDDVNNDSFSFIVYPTKPENTDNNENNKFKKVNNLPVEYLSTLKPNSYIYVYGSWYINRANFVSFTANKIMIDTSKKFTQKIDIAEKPRIEVLNHTKFSAFDGLNSSKEIIKYYVDSKVNCCGICDRKNIQSFPTIDQAVEKTDFKVLYGFEVGFLPNVVECVINSEGCKQNIVDAEYVVFDLETTSLYNEEGEIIEFGGVKIKNGVKTDSLDILIKPSKPVSSFTEHLTHITNEMLSDKPSFKEVIPKIIEWIGDKILVAHNGIDFDIRFLNKKLIQNGIKPLNNPVIDTMQVSKAINPDYAKHKLGYICKNYKIPYDDTIAHRGDFDAEVLSKVWFNFIKILQKMDINMIYEINEKLNNVNLFKKQFPCYCNIYARNKNGLKTLYKLVSLSLQKQRYGDKDDWRPTLFVNQINENRQDLFICSNPFEGDIWDIAINGNNEQLEKAIKFYDYIFLGPVHNLRNLISLKEFSKELVQKTMKKIIDLARKNNKKVIATSNMYYLYEQMHEAYNVFIHNKLVGGSYHRFFERGEKEKGWEQPYFHNLTTQEMKECFSFLNDEKLINEIVVENTYEFASHFERNNIMIKGLFVPEEENVEMKLRNLCFQTLKEQYGDNPIPKIVERLENELKIIIGKGFSVIYWISYELVKNSNENGYYVGSRGSVGSSFAAFCAKISEVNALEPHYFCPKCKHHEFYPDTDEDGFDLPSKKCPICGEQMIGDGHNIPFESFLGTEGAPKVPDIDLNFSGNYQPFAHKFILEKFGQMHAFRAGTIQTLAEKKTQKLVMDYYEMMDNMNNSIKKRTLAHTFWLSRHLVDCKSSDGEHAGGIVVVPKKYEIEDFCPFQWNRDVKNMQNSVYEDCYFTTHFDFHAIHDNILKFDILGHDFPTLFKSMLKTSKINANEINYNDKNVISLFQGLEVLKLKPEQILNVQLGTIAIPECSTSFTLGMIKESKPSCFGDLIRISGLSHGTDVWNGNARDLVLNEGKKLRDVVSFREDMLNFLAKNNVNKDDAFKFAELVRKGNQYKKAKDFLPLVAKLQECNVPQWYIDSCYKIKYLFPKAHATAYMTASYICGWFKIYYAIDFYAAYFSNKIARFDIINIVKGSNAIRQAYNALILKQKTEKKLSVEEEELLDVYLTTIEACERGIKFLKVDLMKSEISEFVIDRENNTLLIPFTCIKSLGIEVARSVIEAREVKKFTDIDDIKERTKLNKNHIKELSELGSFEHFDKSSQMSLFDFFDN